MNIAHRISQSIAVKQQILSDSGLLRLIEECGQIITAAYQNDKKLLICGNGGSAADAQHFAAELGGRFLYDRPALQAEALHCNTSLVTAIANDYSFDDIYARQIQAAGKAGDILVAISTSGQSPNILKAATQARLQKMQIIGLTGQHGGTMAAICDKLIRVPSADTPRVQECHIMIIHLLCEIIETSLFPKEKSE